jgi:hypothetical protein
MRDCEARAESQTTTRLRADAHGKSPEELHLGGLGTHVDRQHPGRPEELDPVLGGQPGEARGLGRTGGDRAHEGLEPRPGDEQPARDPVADADGVRDLLGRQEEVAGPQRVRVALPPTG